MCVLGKGGGGGAVEWLGYIVGKWGKEKWGGGRRKTQRYRNVF